MTKSASGLVPHFNPRTKAWLCCSGYQCLLFKGHEGRAYHVCKERFCVRVIHGIVSVYDFGTQQLLRLRRVASMLYEVCSTRWSAQSLCDQS